jgi:asparagine synthase (glutamine-hydrolysing)
MLLHAFEEWGADCVKRFYGMFAFAVYDGRESRNGRSCTCVRDSGRASSRSTITRTRNGEWLFGSEIRALLAHPDVTPEMDRTAFWHYLTFIVAPAPLTTVPGTFKIPAGLLVVSRSNRLADRSTSTEWWDCRPQRADLMTETGHQRTRGGRRS